jgi:acyl-CoA thioesterase-1
MNPCTILNHLPSFACLPALRFRNLAGLFLLFMLVCMPMVCVAETAVRIVTLGDSITKGARSGVKPEETFAALLEAGLRKQNAAVEVINVGIGGERTDQALVRLSKDVIARKPDVVTIMYGTNDSFVDTGKTESRLSVDVYKANLGKLVDELRAANIVAVLMTEPRWGRTARHNGVNEHPNVRLEKYVTPAARWRRRRRCRWWTISASGPSAKPKARTSAHGPRTKFIRIPKAIAS